MILKILLIVCFVIFALSLIFYALLASGLHKAKNESTLQIIIIFAQCFILPVLYYIIGAVALFGNKSWAWVFIIIGGIVVILLNFNNVGFRFIHVGLYLGALLVRFLEKLKG